MIDNIEIIDFRALKNINIKLGKHITAIAGRNGIGKSTILALLGNSCELKSKTGKTLFNSQFRTEFSEIFKGSEEFDKSSSNKCKINFCNEEFSNVEETKICRVSWQAVVKLGKKVKRFRIIPETKGKNPNSRKKEWPSLYLGLSRLYPIGEVKDEKIKINKMNKLENYDKDYFINNYKNILNVNFKEDEICLDMIDIGDTSRKKGVGINTSNYSSITNSAGQDNIGQIIMAILSFKKLKEKDTNYNGGILLIDEIDATLHPIAQNKLIDFLYKASKDFKIQVVFTTHSISLLKYLSEKVSHNKDEINNNYEIYYFTNNNGPLKSNRNPQYSIIKNDLTLAKPEIHNTVTVYTEDNEGRWMFEKLTSNYSIFLRTVKVKLSCDALLQLNRNDPIYFSNILFVLDGDVSDENIKRENSKKNIIKLPGLTRPEEVVYKFLLNLDSKSDLWKKGQICGFAKENIVENGPESNNYDGKPREKYKAWFNENLEIMEALGVFDYWIEENKEEYIVFLENFKKSYNAIAQRILGTTI